jgi:hypothetical protein
LQKVGIVASIFPVGNLNVCIEIVWLMRFMLWKPATFA